MTNRERAKDDLAVFGRLSRNATEERIANALDEAEARGRAAGRAEMLRECVEALVQSPNSLRIHNPGEVSRWLAETVRP